ncbi:MAG TPA: radical SAM protein [Vicinamibacteria bacterium]
MALTNTCELHCPYCYAPKHRSMLDRENVVRWAQELDSAGCLGLGFGGGEPTAYPHFAELCQQVADQTQLAVTFTTHGHRMTRELAARVVGAVHFIRVSVDGVGATYERLRGRRFDDLKASIGLLASIAPFGVNVVVNSDTVGELDDIAAFAANIGASELLLLPEQPTHRCAGLDTAGSKRLRDWITYGSHSIRTAVSRTGLENALPVADPFPNEDPLEAHVHIDASGTLKPDAYSPVGTPIAESFLDALGRLRMLHS